MALFSTRARAWRTGLVLMRVPFACAIEEGGSGGLAAAAAAVLASGVGCASGVFVNAGARSAR